MALEKQKKAPPCKLAPGDKVVNVQYSKHIAGYVTKVEWSTQAHDHLITLKRSLAGLIIHPASDLVKVPQ